MVMYPVFLDLRGRECLVVGGGRVAARKLKALVAAGARVTVVAPEVSDEIWGPDLKVERREYRPGEAGDYYLVLAATDDEELNRRVSADARSAARPVNVVDAPELCDFFAGSVVRRGDFQVAVSTAGGFPFLARKTRERLEEFFPEAYGPLLDRLRLFRQQVMTGIADPDERRRILKRVADSEAIERYLGGDPGPLEDLLKSCIY